MKKGDLYIDLFHVDFYGITVLLEFSHTGDSARGFWYNWFKVIYSNSLIDLSNDGDGVLRRNIQDPDMIPVKSFVVDDKRIIIRS